MRYGKGNRVFGQAMSKRSNQSTRYQRQFGGGRQNHSQIASTGQQDREAEARDEAAARRRLRQEQGEAIDLQFGYGRLEDQAVDPALPPVQRRGWLFNMLSTTRIDTSSGVEQAGLDLYFVGKDGDTFKTTTFHQPYFYLLTRQDDENLGQLLMKKFGGTLADAKLVPMVDIDMPNHLSPNNPTRNVWKLFFDNVSQLMDVRKQVQEIIKSSVSKTSDETDVMMWETINTSFGQQQQHHQQQQHQSNNNSVADSWANLLELREYDVPYHVRVCMDQDIRAGTWYTVSLEYQEGGPPISHLSEPDIETKGTPKVLAFDIECSKAPLKFPNADIDEIYMISYMISDGKNEPRGYLVSSRSIVSQDIPDFEYTPKPSYPGPFHIFNEVDEETLIRRFVDEYQKHRPQVVVTYNGDSFDWPYLSTRARKYGINLWKDLGITVGEDEVLGRCSVHLDCFAWVQRDSYLPQGAQGLKAVTKYKLGYDPVEVDPEDMLPMAQEQPVHMATYSVSDAVATYYLYEKYVHLFIFSLCTLIPMGPEDVLRKGSGTLCEALLMVQANYLDIICPNKQQDPLAKFHQGHLLESETYIGGKVECLETGVYRNDVEYDFDLKPSAFQQLIDNIDRDLSFAIEVEGGIDRSDIVNYEEVRTKIVEQLELLRDRPKRTEKPFIYHLDVGAMYPNIILTNRLQPNAMVDDATCAACDFNQSKNGCKRKMDWVWRGDYTPAGKLEYERTKDQLSREVMKDGQQFKELPEKEQAAMVASRLKEYSRNAYRKTKITEEITRKDTVCMRENDMYVSTVRRFRDRRYDYKKMTKAWKKKIGTATDQASKKEAEDKALVYDSLQVAHKCILNSFYGYVMRKGARWRSMEMAGIVTKTGADLITQARILVEQIGRPLELDTDGIWCILPGSFPDVYSFKTKDGSKVKIEYPCLMLNADVHDNFTNHQYQTLVDQKTGKYETRSECSIFFEVDGPYRCMVLPASTEEGKLLKKRYAVFNFDGSLAELKGFELKRRGELELIKTFQSQVFERFLDGESLEECYDSVAEVANHWIDVIDTRGDSLDDDELVDLISENRNMSRQLEDYGDQKGTSQTTARRLGEFLGAEIIKDKGLNCKFIIAEQPYGAPVTDRAIPTAILQAEPAVMKHFLRKWLKSPGLDGDGFDIRNILDWDYYLERLSKTIQKIITIPAALQKVDNPVPRVAHPSWLDAKVQQLNDRFQQTSIKNMFAAKSKENKPRALPLDMEDFGNSSSGGSKRPVVHSIRKRGTQVVSTENTTDGEHEARIELSKSNFSGWLKQKKEGWRRSRKSRRALGDENVANGDNGSTRKKQIGSMEGFVKEAAQNLTHREWQVIELREMSRNDAGNSKQSSGEFVAWVMIGTDSLRKVQISVPRVVYLATKQQIATNSADIQLKKVERYLPHSKSAAFLYEVSMSEFVYRNKDWAQWLHPESGSEGGAVSFESVYETGTPLRMRALMELGCVSKLSNSSSAKRRTHLLSDLKRVERPTEGLYLNNKIFYRRAFLYFRIHPKTRSGIIALFSMRNGNGGDETDVDVTAPSKAGQGNFDISSECKIWIVKPGSSRGQKSISTKQCEGIFGQLIQAVQETTDLESEYSCVSSASTCELSTLNFVNREDEAFGQISDAISSFAKSANGPAFLLMNSNKSSMRLRNKVSAMSTIPVVPLPFPPGPDHNSSMSTLPALNWEQPAVQLCFEAYLYMGVISFPKRVAFARYGNLPIGNLGAEEDFTLYEIQMARMLQQNRALSWASQTNGGPDLGASFLPSSDGKLRLAPPGSSLDDNDVWGDDNDLISPVVRKPGCYRTICVDIDVHDLAIAALTEMVSSSHVAASNQPDGQNPSSPTSVLDMGLSDHTFKTPSTTEPLGDEMSTSTALPMLRGLVAAWLKDAFTLNNEVADSMLHQVYRLVSNPGTLMHDPALHRVVHSLMKSTFMRLLCELQRLGCSIVYATFHRLTVATNKINLADAEEYIQFVISTVQKKAVDREGGSVLSRIALHPRQFHSHYLFLDEYNFGTMHLERLNKNEVDGQYHIDEENGETAVVPAVVTAWSLMNFLGSDIAKEYFRIIVGRFSKEALKKQVELNQTSQNDTFLSVYCKEMREELLAYRQKMVSKHFASYLTRAVAEIMKDYTERLETEGRDAEVVNPVLEFTNSVMTILSLDSEVDNEVHVLKRSLLSQIGVAEYSSLATWVNPCPTFILPDVFCVECQETRDVNLCYTPPSMEEGNHQQHWFCDCGTEYDTSGIEQRLIAHVHRSLMRYQIQDIRCTKTKRVSNNSLAKVSTCGADFCLDVPTDDARRDIQTLRNLAKHHGLEELLQATTDVLTSFR